MDNDNTNQNTATNTTTVKLDKGTKLILVMIALGLFLNAVPNLTQAAYAQLSYGDKIEVKVSGRLEVDDDGGTFDVRCYGCN
ncbi:MAG: hypothetical protein ACR2P4_07660 [Gammaproteobacteria bacterium]